VAESDSSSFRGQRRSSIKASTWIDILLVVLIVVINVVAFLIFRPR